MAIIYISSVFVCFFVTFCFFALLQGARVRPLSLMYSQKVQKVGSCCQRCTRFINAENMSVFYTLYCCVKGLNCLWKKMFPLVGCHSVDNYLCEQNTQGGITGIFCTDIFTSHDYDHFQKKLAHDSVCIHISIWVWMCVCVRANNVACVHVSSMCMLVHIWPYTSITHWQ